VVLLASIVYFALKSQGFYLDFKHCWDLELYHLFVIFLMASRVQRTCFELGVHLHGFDGTDTCMVSKIPGTKLEGYRVHTTLFLTTHKQHVVRLATMRLRTIQTTHSHNVSSFEFTITYLVTTSTVNKITSLIQLLLPSASTKN